MANSSYVPGRYQPVLDGLRALSIVAVLLYHNDGLLPGGYLGVDVFFVLSGFLITSVLLDEWRRTGGFDLRAFYARRALRLFPALGALLLVAAAFVLAFPHASQSATLKRGIVSSLLYVSNWAEMRDPMLLGPLNHTWSLAIEEQFYFVWPLLLLGFLRLTRGRRALSAVIGGLALAFAGWRLVLVHLGSTPWRVYVGTDTRADSLLVGSATAIAMSLGDLPRALGGARVARVLSVPAVAVLVWLAATTPLAWPGYGKGGFLGVAVATAVVFVALLSSPTWAPARLLSTGPFVWVGQRSYSLYLWHLPVFGFIKPEHLPLEPGAVPVLRVVASFVIAAASHTLVERPFLRLKQRFRVARDAQAVLVEPG